MALGARSADVRKMVVLQGLIFSLLGVAVGISAAFGLARLLATFLFGVKPWDPTVFIAVPVVLTLIALIAVLIPAIRATRIDPMTARRHD